MFSVGNLSLCRKKLQLFAFPTFLTYETAVDCLYLIELKSRDLVRLKDSVRHSVMFPTFRPLFNDAKKTTAAHWFTERKRGKVRER